MQHTNKHPTAIWETCGIFLIIINLVTYAAIGMHIYTPLNTNNITYQVYDDCKYIISPHTNSISATENAIQHCTKNQIIHTYHAHPNVFLQSINIHEARPNANTINQACKKSMEHIVSIPPYKEYQANQTTILTNICIQTANHLTQEIQP